MDDKKKKPNRKNENKFIEKYCKDIENTAAITSRDIGIITRCRTEIYAERLMSFKADFCAPKHDIDEALSGKAVEFRNMDNVQYWTMALLQEAYETVVMRELFVFKEGGIKRLQTKIGKILPKKYWCYANFLHVKLLEGRIMTLKEGFKLIDRHNKMIQHFGMFNGKVSIIPKEAVSTSDVDSDEK